MTQAERDKQMFKAGWTMGWADGNLGVPNLSTRIFTADRAWALYNQDRAPKPVSKRNPYKRVNFRSDICILDCDSPSYPPEPCEYFQCSCRSCLDYIRKNRLTKP